MTAIKDLAKLIRKDFRVEGIKASVRCSHGQTTSACHIVVKTIPLELESEVRRNAGNMGGRGHGGAPLTPRQIFKRALQDHVESIVDKHIPLNDRDSSDYAFVDVSEVPA
jgi:hypothetical protein